MKYITIINLTARLIFLALIFIVVKSQSDYLFVPLLNGVGAFIGGLIGLYVIFVKDKLKFRMQPFKNLWFYLRQSSPLFGSYAIISVKDRFNVIFIGSSLGMKEVAIYDLAIKIMGLFMQPIEIVNSTVYPKIAKEKDMKFVVNVSKYLFIGILLMIIAIQPLLSPIINFLGKGLSDAILPTRLMLIAPLIMVWSQGIGRNILLTNGLYKHFSWGMVLTTTFYLLQIGSAFILSINKFLLTFVAITLSTYLFELLYRWIVAKKHDLI
jgi:PST family polysaccharide transporter